MWIKALLGGACFWSLRNLQLFLLTVSKKKVHMWGELSHNIFVVLRLSALLKDKKHRVVGHKWATVCNILGMMTDKAWVQCICQLLPIIFPKLRCAFMMNPSWLSGTKRMAETHCPGSRFTSIAWCPEMVLHDREEHYVIDSSVCHVDMVMTHVQDPQFSAWAFLLLVSSLLAASKSLWIEIVK